MNSFRFACNSGDRVIIIIIGTSSMSNFYWISIYIRTEIQKLNIIGMTLSSSIGDSLLYLCCAD